MPDLIPNPFGQEPPPLRRRLRWRNEHPKRPRSTVTARMPRSLTKLVRVGVLLLVVTGTIYAFAGSHHTSRRGSPETKFRVPGLSGYTSNEVVAMVERKVTQEGVFNASQESITCPGGSYTPGSVLTCTLASPKGNGNFDVEVTESGISIKLPKEAG